MDRLNFIDKSLYKNKQSNTDEYCWLFLHKEDFNENDFSCCYANNKKSTSRIGWIVPAISLISDQHDLYQSGDRPHKIYGEIATAILSEHDKAIQKKSSKETYQIDFDEIPDNLYILILNKERMLTNNIKTPYELLFSLGKYGLFIFENSKHYTKKIYLEIESKTVLAPTVDIENTHSFFNLLITEVTPKEEKIYSRFMFIYQCFEIFMELNLYKKINEGKQKKNRIIDIKEDVTKLSTERTNITDIFSTLVKLDISTKQKLLLKSALGDSKNTDYYNAANKTSLYYDIRNTVVHNYHRFSNINALEDITAEMEHEVYTLIEKIYYDSMFKAELTAYISE